jgi:cytochrome c oxidase assembly protein subunit 15
LTGLVGLGVALAAVVVVLGAWTRLVDAGLGCPDWPGCYGFLSVPDAEHEIAAAEARFPHAPVEAHKAWPEMIHRYFASALGLLILTIAGVAYRHRAAGAPLGLPVLLVALVILQGAFGAWTVTLKLWPQVVTLHLLGGMSTLALLWLLHLRLRSVPAAMARLAPHAWLALGVVVLQIALGGWTTSNYAALACPDFPTCQNSWWPRMDFGRAFNVAQEVGPNYLGGLLHADARIAIHMAHRLGAVAVLLVVGSLAWRLFAAPHTRLLGGVLGTVLLAQIGLGVANVLYSLPLGVATAHNAVGALLLLTVVTVNYRTLRPGVAR